MNAYDFLHFVRHNRAFFALDCHSNEEALRRFLPLWDGFRFREVFLPYECFEKQIFDIVRDSVEHRLSDLISSVDCIEIASRLTLADWANTIEHLPADAELFGIDRAAMIEMIENTIAARKAHAAETIPYDLEAPEADLDFILDNFLESHKDFKGQAGWDALRTHKIAQFDVLIGEAFFGRPVMYWNSANKLTPVNFLMFLFGMRCGTKVLGDIAENVPSIDGLFSFIFEHYKMRSFPDLIAYFAAYAKEDQEKALLTLRNEIKDWFAFWKELNGPFEYAE